jgi:predicted NUDIX family NTP pyrophosphohydrolase
MRALSCGLLLYRLSPELEVFLVHPGGPFFVNKDDYAWGVPKGLIEPGEDRLTAARREFEEETGFSTPEEGYIDLGEVEQTRKTVQVFAFEGDADPAALESNTFELEWPPRSGRTQRFPEVDRGDFFALDRATEKMSRAQQPLLERLARALLDRA